MSHPDPSKVCYDVCELCGKEINDPDDIQYPHGHHGEPVQCLSCYSSGLDAVCDSSEGA